MDLKKDLEKLIAKKEAIKSIKENTYATLKKKRNTKRIDNSNTNQKDNLPAVRVGRLRGISADELMDLGSELLDWAKLDTSLILGDFFCERNLIVSDFYDWCDKDPVLNLAKRTALFMIGSRREKLALFNKANAHIVMHTMPRYSKEDKELVEWRAKLSQDKGQNEAKPIVIMERYIKYEDKE